MDILRDVAVGPQRAACVSQTNKLLGVQALPVLLTVSYALPTVLHKYVKTVAPKTCFVSARILQSPPRKRSIGVWDVASITVSAPGSRDEERGDGKQGIGRVRPEQRMWGNKVSKKLTKVIETCSAGHLAEPALAKQLRAKPRPTQTRGCELLE